MEAIYLKVVERLKTVSGLNWIDAEDGQLDFFEERPPVAFPCAIIDVEYPGCEDESETIQMVTARISIRLAFEPKGATNSKAPETVQTTALARYAIVKNCFDALQGWSDGEVGSLSRKSQTTEKREDNLKVIVQVWETNFEEESGIQVQE